MWHMYHSDKHGRNDFYIIDIFLCGFNTGVKAVAMNQVTNLPTF